MFEKTGFNTTFVDENHSGFAPSFAPHSIGDDDHARQPPITDGPTP